MAMADTYVRAGPQNKKKLSEMSLLLEVYSESGITRRFLSERKVKK